MADKLKRSLPPPPDRQSIFESLLSGAKRAIYPSYPGMFQQPVAQSRITRTPIYNAPDVAKWDEGKMGEYHPDTDEIMVRPSSFQDIPYDRENSPLIAHESTHAIYDKANLSPGSILGNKPPPDVEDQLDWAMGMPFHVKPEQLPMYQRNRANESLAYSVGNPEATDFIENIADQIQDPILAAQLRRLHYNALATKKLSR